MNIVRVFGLSLSDLFALFTGVDHEYGRPEGLAHWNGSVWHWRRRLNNHWSLDAKVIGKKIFLLGFDNILLGEKPEDLELEKPGFIGLNSLYVNENGFLYIVGNGGLFISNHTGKWKKIDTGLTNDLYSITECANRLWVSGSKGCVFNYSGERVELVSTGTDYDFTKIDVRNEVIVVTGGKINSKHGMLISIQNGRITNVSSTSERLFSIVALSESEIYGITPFHKLCVFDGKQLSNIDIDGEITYISRLFDFVLCSGKENLLVFGPPFRTRVPVEGLDESFLA